MDWITAHAGPLRLATFVGALVLLASLEALRPRRIRSRGRLPRWGFNAALLGLSVALARIVVPLGTVGVALWARAKGLGVLGAAPVWLDLVLTFAILDLAIYAQHRAFHRVPLLWKLHRIHHTDVDLDASSALRFHPLEILVSLGGKGLLVAALGMSPASVVLYESCLGLFSILTHANLDMGGGVDSVLRRVFVTPDLHRIHHSIHGDETNRNFGTVTPAWDRLFGTFLGAPREPHMTMTLGTRDGPPATERPARP